ncbi:hypothetical protein HanIR_Chr06g0296851 [Helianthus annuus]|nr:hypothetical protein HanIR_Chr06g0296851 [Helianthus annuus]
MSCTSPWDWSTDSQPVQKPTSMAEYLANTIPRQHVTTLTKPGN